jgi:hypothetical protein
MEFGQDPETAAAVTRGVVRATTLPVIVKLTPNVADPRVIARAVVDAGAHALCVGNTLQAMLVDTASRKPVIGMTFAGLSGPALKPVNLRQVYQVAQAVQVPIIGCGGIRRRRCARISCWRLCCSGARRRLPPATPIEVLEGIEVTAASTVVDVGEPRLRTARGHLRLCPRATP